MARSRRGADQQVPTAQMSLFDAPGSTRSATEKDVAGRGHGQASETPPSRKPQPPKPQRWHDLPNGVPFKTTYTVGGHTWQIRVWDEDGYRCLDVEHDQHRDGIEAERYLAGTPVPVMLSMAQTYCNHAAEWYSKREADHSGLDPDDPQVWWGYELHNPRQLTQDQ